MPISVEEYLKKLKEREAKIKALWDGMNRHLDNMERILCEDKDDNYNNSSSVSASPALVSEK